MNTDLGWEGDLVGVGQHIDKNRTRDREGFSHDRRELVGILDPPGAQAHRSGNRGGRRVPVMRMNRDIDTVDMPVSLVNTVSLPAISSITAATVSGRIASLAFSTIERTFSSSRPVRDPLSGPISACC